METTLDLPDDLVREINLNSGSVALQRPVIKSHPKTGLPYIECPHEAAMQEEMLPERIAELLLNQEVAWQHDVG